MIDATRAVAPYGAWRSPISADLLVAGTVRLGQIALDDGDVYWEESRPTEGGRTVVVRRAADGRTEDVTPPPFNARTRVHEYGGGAFAVEDGLLVFSNFADNRLYRRDGDSLPQPASPDAPTDRYADLVLDRRRNRLVCVRENHSASDQEPVNTLVAVDLDTPDQGSQVLVGGNDFYASPRLSPDGEHLAWLTWNHPNMPWDGCELWLGELAVDGAIASSRLVAGGSDESIFQPEWSPGGALCFVSDRSGWWNLYRLPTAGGAAEPLWPVAAELGEPQWVFGQPTYALPTAARLVCAPRQDGSSRLTSIDLATGERTTIATASTSISGLRATSQSVVFRGGTAGSAPAIIRLDLAFGREETLRAAGGVALDPADLSTPRPLAFPTEGGLTAHAFHYPPTNARFAAPAGELPPLIVQSHGGPTAGTSTTLNLAVQYWTSRGFAVLDVDYGGSSGYGRAYRRRLDGTWGIVDVDDCLNAARFLIGEGLADPERVAIRGGSASGYTTLAALAFRDLFKAGASHYGIGDLEAMTRDTHKFESRYLDRLVAPYPERRDVYLARSPVHHAERISAPLILFQGLDDKVVPPNQAEAMVETLTAKGLPVAYVPFAGEGHGFRRAENITRALEAELSFYAQVFGIPLPDPIDPVPIANLPARTALPPDPGGER